MKVVTTLKANLLATCGTHRYTPYIVRLWLRSF